MILQVDRVASVEEAVAFRDAGATLIGLDIGTGDRRFADGRAVSPDLANAIRRAAAPAKIAALFEGTDADGCATVSAERLNAIRAFRPDYIQIWHGDLEPPLAAAVRGSGLPVIGDGAALDADHGAWIEGGDAAPFLRAQMRDLPEFAPAFFHLDVISDRADPFAFFAAEAPEYPDEAPQMADLAAAVRSLPLVLSVMGVPAESATAYAAAFPAAHGFFARLGEGGGVPVMSADAALFVFQGMCAAARATTEAA